jgi:C1A family cysteine protease
MKRITVIFSLLLFTIFIIGLTQQQDTEQQLKALQTEIEKQGYSFKVGDNPAMKYSISQLCGLKELPDWQATAKEQNIFKLKPKKLKTLTVGLPPAWNWQDQNGMTDIRDQDGCGSCWAFAAIGSFESLLRIEQDTITDLSEQHLVSCNTWGWGCDGGWWPHDMLVDPGAVLEVDFPYTATDAPCGGPYNYAFNLKGWAYVDGNNKVPSIEKIKQALYEHGPICAAVYVGFFFQGYTSGVFDKDESPGSCSCTPSSPVNHAILLTGWDDSKGAWRLKNSWSSGWGESGYMWIKYNISNVGYAAVIVY